MSVYKQLFRVYLLLMFDDYIDDNMSLSSILRWNPCHHLFNRNRSAFFSHRIDDAAWFGFWS